MSKALKLLLASPVLFLRAIIYSANAGLHVLDQIKYDIDSLLDVGAPRPLGSASEVHSMKSPKDGLIEDHSPFSMQ
jgi:hypothetical protein